MITETSQQPAPVFGRDGEPCAACGAPLAGDQRYCLHCGSRRPEARLEFLDVLDADVRARGVLSVAAPVGVGGALPPAGRLQAHAGTLALGSVILLTLLIGLLVGHWVTGRDTPTAAAPAAPQVITLQGAPSSATPAAAAASSTGSSSSTKSAASTAKSKAKASTPPKDAVSVTGSDKKAINDAVKKGKPLSTGTGAPPPKDDKPAGGGSGFETIG